MVKVMRKLRTVTPAFVMMILALTLVKSTVAQTSNETQTFFSSEYAGISIQFNATRETVPGANITINLWINCTADGVYLDYLNLTVYGYSHFKYGLEKTTLNATCVMQKTALIFNHTSEYNYTVPVPNNVWDLTYAELNLKYTIKGDLIEHNESFSITTVRNVLWEELEETLRMLNETYQRLNVTYWQLNTTFEQLNQTFWEAFQMNLTAENLALLNMTYWELQQNYTMLQVNQNDLNNTRTAVAVLAITTVFFVATTVYMVMRKPKQSW
jgi:hypothetical protein